jgi:hypothetical protein
MKFAYYILTVITLGFIPANLWANCPLEESNHSVDQRPQKTAEQYFTASAAEMVACYRWLSHQEDSLSAAIALDYFKVFPRKINSEFDQLARELLDNRESQSLDSIIEIYALAAGSRDFTLPSSLEKYFLPTEPESQLLRKDSSYQQLFEWFDYRRANAGKSNLYGNNPIDQVLSAPDNQPLEQQFVPGSLYLALSQNDFTDAELAKLPQIAEIILSGLEQRLDKLESSPSMGNGLNAIESYLQFFMMLDNWQPATVASNQPVFEKDDWPRLIKLSQRFWDIQRNLPDDIILKVGTSPEFDNLIGLTNDWDQRQLLNWLAIGQFQDEWDSWKLEFDQAYNDFHQADDIVANWQSFLSTHFEKSQSTLFPLLAASWYQRQDYFSYKTPDDVMKFNENLYGIYETLAQNDPFGCLIDVEPADAPRVDTKTLITNPCDGLGHILDSVLTPIIEGLADHQNWDSLDLNTAKGFFYLPSGYEAMKLFIKNEAIGENAFNAIFPNIDQLYLVNYRPSIASVTLCRIAAYEPTFVTHTIAPDDLSPKADNQQRAFVRASATYFSVMRLGAHYAEPNWNQESYENFYERLIDVQSINQCGDDTYEIFFRNADSASDEPLPDSFKEFMIKWKQLEDTASAVKDELIWKGDAIFSPMWKRKLENDLSIKFQ